MEYEHTQYGYTGFLTTVSLGFITGLSLPQTFQDEPLMGLLILILFLALIGLTFWFSWLTVTVRDGIVTTAFGLGKPHRVVQLSDVVGARKVRNQWVQGWGVRKIPHGWMYNVWGLDAVELELSSGRVFRIGTDESNELQAAIMLQPDG